MILCGTKRVRSRLKSKADFPHNSSNPFSGLQLAENQKVHREARTTHATALATAAQGTDMMMLLSLFHVPLRRIRRSFNGGHDGDSTTTAVHITLEEELQRVLPSQIQTRPPIFRSTSSSSSSSSDAPPSCVSERRQQLAASAANFEDACRRVQRRAAQRRHAERYGVKPQTVAADDAQHEAERKEKLEYPLGMDAEEFALGLITSRSDLRRDHLMPRGMLGRRATCLHELHGRRMSSVN
jgi:hypothetical protein